jgi:hypothetical protein
MEKESWENPIFGVISTASYWIFVKYDGNEWIESLPMAISSVNDIIGIENVLEALYKILQHQNDLVASIHQEKRKVKNRSIRLEKDDHCIHENAGTS